MLFFDYIDINIRTLNDKCGSIKLFSQLLWHRISEYDLSYNLVIWFDIVMHNTQ